MICDNIISRTLECMGQLNVEDVHVAHDPNRHTLACLEIVYVPTVRLQSDAVPWFRDAAVDAGGFLTSASWNSIWVSLISP